MQNLINNKGIEETIQFIEKQQRQLDEIKRELVDYLNYVKERKFEWNEEGSVDEEKRLFYVAVTRAKEELYLLRSKKRLVRGVMRPAQPSPFLAMIDGEFANTVEPEDILKTADKKTMSDKFAELYALLDS